MLQKHKRNYFSTLIVISIFVISMTAFSDSNLTDNNQAVPTMLGFKSGEIILWDVQATGGIPITSETYSLNSTVGQACVSSFIASENYNLHSGYWQSLSSACDCQPGNANGDGAINILDITYLIAYLYSDGSAPIPYAVCSGDANGDCTVNILDITYLIGYLYQELSPPIDCLTWRQNCGSTIYKVKVNDIDKIKTDITK